MHGFMRQLPVVRLAANQAAGEEQRRMLTLVDNKARAAYGHGQRLAREESEQRRDGQGSAENHRGRRPLSRTPASGYLGPRTSAEAFAIAEALRELETEIRRGYRR